jgi:hypothetical protein
MSSTRQALVLSPSLIGFGNFPDFTPFKNVVRPIGIIAGILRFLLPQICQPLRKPVSGIWWDVVVMLSTLLVSKVLHCIHIF